MSAEDNKAIIRRLYDQLFGQWNLALIDELFSPDYIGHELPAGTPRGPAGVHQLYADIRADFPGITLTVQDIIGEGDKVVTRWVAESAPTTGIAIYRFHEGKIVERWVEVTFHQSISLRRPWYMLEVPG